MRINRKILNASWEVKNNINCPPFPVAVMRRGFLQLVKTSKLSQMKFCLKNL